MCDEGASRPDVIPLPFSGSADPLAEVFPAEKLQLLLGYFKLAFSFINPIATEILRDKIAARSYEEQLVANEGVLTHPNNSAAHAYKVADSFLAARAGRTIPFGG